MNRVRQWLNPNTLFGRTALALAGAFLLFGFISTILLQISLVRPYTKQAADDLAAFLVLAAQIWVERAAHKGIVIGKGGAKMPYCMFYDGGYAIHGSYEVQGYHASHGCVRTYIEDARWLK